jgi:putative endonuclease
MDDVERKQAGRSAEDLALRHLADAGLQTVARNFRCRCGEIDLVMLEGETLVLVEVRYRASDEYGGAAASVTWRKQRRLVCAARFLLMRRPELRRYPARFDVIAVSRDGRIEWIRHAFR